MSDFAPINVSKMTNIVIDQIQKRIGEGTLKAGDKLPSERKLAAQLGVSRATIRESIGILGGRGVLKISHGKSTIICDVFKKHVYDPLEDIVKNSDELTADVISVRHLLEVEATRLAAINRTTIDMQIIEDAYLKLSEAQKNNDLAEHVKADTQFHISIADASHNLILTQIIRSMGNLIEKDILKTVEILSNDVGWREKLFEQHTRIFQAILNEDENSAEKAADKHLIYIRKQLEKASILNIRMQRSQRRNHI